MNFEEGNYKNIHYGDILIKFPTLVDSKTTLIPFINKNIVITPKMNLLKDGDIVIADTAEDYTAGKAIELVVREDNILSGLHTIPCRPKFKFSSGYLGYYLNSQSFRKNLLPLIQGIKVYSVSKYMFKLLYINYPSLEEQQKVSELLFKVDQQIDTQNKIIEELKLLKKSVNYDIFHDLSNFDLLENVCDICTGKLDANKYNENGLYPFFTCGRETLSINEYAFDCEAILIAGNGDMGTSKYYKGKFNAYQRTYVLFNFKDEAMFLKNAIDYYLPTKIASESQSSAMSYIKIDTLKKLKIPVIDNASKEKIININKLLDAKLANEEAILKNYLLQKSYFLNNLFI